MPARDRNVTSSPSDSTFSYPSSGILPVIGDQNPAVKKDPRSNAATGATAAGVRAFTAQAIAFYFRAPAKAFFRTRVDYMAYARNLQQNASQSAQRCGVGFSWVSWWRSTTPGLLANAVRISGWRVIPEQVLPPMMANVAVGAVLYTSYLQILGRLHEPSSEVRKRVFPPPELQDTFLAGLLAGGLQSIVAAPLDAVQVRYERRSHNGVGIDNSRRDQTLWNYGKEKLKEIGWRGMFAGWTLTFAKDSLGSGVFFSVFEYTKAQGYYNFVRWYYGALQDDVVDVLSKKRPIEGRTQHQEQSRRIIKPYYAIEPAFLLLAGMAASFAQQGVLYPLNNIQTRHFERLEELDNQFKRISAAVAAHRSTKGRMLSMYYNAYEKTWRDCQIQAVKHGGMRSFLYQGFWWHTFRQAPSTSAGLIIFELVRRKYGMDADEVKISQDGYDIIL